MALVRSVARALCQQFALRGVDEDLEGYGFEGLVRAARRYDPRHGVPFGSFARYRIQGAMLDGMAEVGGIPRRLYRRFRFARAASDVTGSWLDDGATTSGHGLRGLLHMAYLVSCDATSDGPTDTARVLFRQRLAVAWEHLDERQRTLLYAHYYRGVSLAEAGRALGISRSAATRLHKRALEALRSTMSLSAVPALTQR